MDTHQPGSTAAVKRIRDFAAEVYSIWVGERPSQQAAALAYYGMFSFAPVIYVGFTIAGIFIDNSSISERLYGQLQNVIGVEAATQVQDMVSALAQANSRGTFLISLISFFALYFAASGLFFQIQYALNVIWRIPPPKKGQTQAFLRKRISAFIMVIGVSLLLVAAALINLILAWFGSLIARIFGTGITPVILTWVASLGLIAVSFALLYKFLPDVRITFQDVWLGALTAALLVLAAGLAATLYFRNGSLGNAFEAAGAFAILLIGIYYFAQIFLLGAVITRVFATMYGSQRPAG